MAKYNVGDKINFLEYEYCLEPVGHRYYWNIINKPSGADKIFKYIHLEKNSFSKKVLGYYYKDTVFPEMETLEDVEKLTDALLLECAKFRYPVGTTYISVAGNEYKAERLPYFFNKKGDIAVKEGGGLVYENCNNKWAEVVEEPKVEIKFEVGKWYTFYTVDKKYHLIAKCGGTTEINFLFADRWYISNLIKKEADFIAIEYMIEPTLLTNLSIIQQYLPDGHPDKIKEFILPEKWCIKVQENSCPGVVREWRQSPLKNYGDWIDAGYICGDRGYHTGSTKNFPKGYTEITLEQFKKYILKEEKEEAPEKVRKFKLGDTIYLVNDIGKNAPKGSSAKVVGYTDKYVNIKWIDTKGKKQNDGGYYEKDFSLENPMKEEFKIGDWITITGSDVNWSPAMDKYIGRTVQITGYIDPQRVTFEGYDGWYWCYEQKHFRRATTEEINSVTSPKEKNRVVNGVEMIKGEYYYCESNHDPSSHFVFIYDRHGTGKGKDAEISYIYTSQQVSTLYGKFGLKGINDAHHANMRLATVREREWLDACVKAGKYLEPNDWPLNNYWGAMGILPISTPLTPKDCERNLTLSVDDEELPMVKPSKEIKVTNKLTID